MTLTEIAARSELPLSTAHRLVNQLADWQVLDRTGNSGGFRIGTPIRSTACHCGIGVLEREEGMRTSVAPVMEDLFLATGLQVRAGLLDGMEVAYVDKGSIYRPVSRATPAARLPAHATAMGKVLLAYSSKRVVDVILARNLKQYTPFTVTNPERLRATFHTIRANRIAVCDCELDSAWRAVAAPVFGPTRRVVAAIELRVPDLAEEASAVRSILTVGARSLSRQLAQNHLCEWSDADLSALPVTSSAENGRRAARVRCCLCAATANVDVSDNHGNDVTTRLELA